MTVLESIVVMLLCVVIFWIVFPIAMVRLGWKEAGSMVVVDGDKAPQSSGPQLDPKILKPRVTGVEAPRVIEPGPQSVGPSPTIPSARKQ